MALSNILLFKYRFVQKMIDENQAKIRKSEEASDIAEVDKYLDQAQELKNMDMELAKSLSIIIGREGIHKRP
jgi:hypothetical protein